MPVVDLSDATFKRLQALARPLIDTPSSVIDRLIDHYEDARQAAVNRTNQEPVAMRKFDALDVPSLTHTKLRKVVIGGNELPRPNWNELLRQAIEIGLDRLGSFDKLVRVTDAHIVEGVKTDEGFSPLATRGISVQGVDAHDAWRIAFGLIRKFSLPIEVVFEWRDKEGAPFPGEIGIISWGPP